MSDDDKGPNCEQLLANYMDAFEAYMEDDSVENEQALNDAQTALENNCDFEIEVE